MAPIHVKIITVEVNSQNFIFSVVLNLEDFLDFLIGNAKIKIDAAKARTPPNFEGMDRKIT